MFGQHALAYAGQKNRDVVLYDTAGRLAIDEEMMSELEQIKSRVGPENILLVADAMIGQDAVKTAAERSSEMMVTATSVRRQFVRRWSACWRWEPRWMATRPSSTWRRSAFARPRA